MSVWNGWTINTGCPTSPAPKDVQPSFEAVVGVSVSPYSRQQQTQDWGGRQQTWKVSLPPMAPTDGQAWVNFLLSLIGPLQVFQFPSAWVSGWQPWTLPYSQSGYWRLKPGQDTTGWSVSDAHIYGLTFTIMEAL